MKRYRIKNAKAGEKMRRKVKAMSREQQKAVFAKFGRGAPRRTQRIGKSVGTSDKTTAKERIELVRRREIEGKLRGRKRERGKKYTKRVKNIQKEIYFGLYDPKPENTKKELMVIIVPRDRAHHFNFLRAYTGWNAVGKWKDEPFEKNVKIEIEYRDDPEDRLGKKLRRIISEDYNAAVIGEEVLLCRTEPIEKSTIEIEPLSKEEREEAMKMFA